MTAQPTWQMEGPLSLAPAPQRKPGPTVPAARPALRPPSESTAFGGKRRRWSSELLVNYHLPGVAFDEAGAHESALPADIDGDCIFIRTSELVPVGTLLECAIFRNESALATKVTAIVRYCREEERAPGFGVEIRALEHDAWLRVAHATSSYLMGATEKKDETDAPVVGRARIQRVELMTRLPDETAPARGPRWKLVAVAGLLLWGAAFAAFAA